MPRFRERASDVEVMARQVRPDNWQTTVRWCSGWPTYVDGNQGVLVVDGDRIVGHASLGDYVVQAKDGTFHAADAGTFARDHVEV